MDPIESLRDWAERASTFEWAIGVMAATAVFWGLGFALRKLLGSKRP
jgi:hypothetical protein